MRQTQGLPILNNQELFR
jgi:hypothetical protein